MRRSRRSARFYITQTQAETLEKRAQANKGVCIHCLMRYNKANDVEQLVTMIRKIGQGRAGGTGSLQAAFKNPHRISSLYV